MKRIPDEIIESVLKHHDIVDIVGKYVHLTKSGRYLKGLCPFHSEKTPSFTVTPDKQIFYCYGCHAGGNAIHFLMEIEGYSFTETVQLLAEEANIPLHLENSNEVQSKQQQELHIMVTGHEFAARVYHHVMKNTVHGEKAMQYLKQRGFSEKMIDTFQLGFAPPLWSMLSDLMAKREYSLPLMEKAGLISARTDNSGYVDRFRNRIMFPIADARGRIIAFAGRSLGAELPKYVNSPETPLFNKSRNIYNFHMARNSIRKRQKAVLFEGYADVIQGWEAGIANGIATMGTSLTESHALLIRRYTNEVVICYDGDEAGQTAAYKNINILEETGIRVNIAMIPQKLDPDEFIRRHGGERFKREIIENTVSAIKFKLLYSKRGFQLQHEDEKLRYIQKALGIVAGLSSPTEREHYMRELSEEFHYSIDSLKQDLLQIRGRMQKMNGRGDNKNNSWNNVRNNEKKSQKKSLFPAYHNAEKHLLALMMIDGEVARLVQEELGDQFNVELHAALAAYLYAFYSQGYEADASRFMATLQDDQFARLASSILSGYSEQSWNQQAVKDYIREIKKYPQQQEIKRKKEEMVQLERSGQFLQAAQIASEIITLEKQMKSM